MSQETQRHEITKKRVVYQMPAERAVTVRRGIEYRVTEAGALTMDIYYPPDSNIEARIPAVVFVSGYPDPGLQKTLGCKLKEMESYISWGQLTAASGLVAITYTTGEGPAQDIYALLQYVRQNAAVLGIDENRIGLWACSGNVPNALSVLMQEAQECLKCAVLCYGCMLDLDGFNHMAEASRTWGAAYPCAGKSVEDLPHDIPLFIARAGRDKMPHLNETLDRFLGKALKRNMPVTFVNHPEAPHAFDLLHDSETSREIIKQILAFMRFHLLTYSRSRGGSMSDPIDGVIDEIITARPCGIVSCAIAARDDTARLDPDDELNALARGVGIEYLSGLRTVDRTTAAAILRTVLHHDLAYGSPMMSIEEAERLASRFLDEFGEDAHFLTNGTIELSADAASGLNLAVLGSWTPVTSATFDTGVACVSKDFVGILWVQDED
jgi:hypothetical protein